MLLRGPAYRATFIEGDWSAWKLLCSGCSCSRASLPVSWSGSVYALLALAIVMIFKTSEVPNFAQGEVLMATGYACAVPAGLPGVPMLDHAAADDRRRRSSVAALFRRGVLTQVAHASGSPVNLVIATLGLVLHA